MISPVFRQQLRCALQVIAYFLLRHPRRFGQG